MKIEAKKVVTLQYDLYVDGENGQEELMEKATSEAPLVYCHGEGMMLPAFEQAMEGLAEGVRMGGKLSQELRKLKVKGNYNNIPERLVVNVEKLGLGKTIQVGALSYDNLTILNSVNNVVAAVKLTRAARGAAAAKK